MIAYRQHHRRSCIYVTLLSINYNTIWYDSVAVDIFGGGIRETSQFRLLPTKAYRNNMYVRESKNDAVVWYHTSMFSFLQLIEDYWAIHSRPYKIHIAPFPLSASRNSYLNGDICIKIRHVNGRFDMNCCKTIETMAISCFLMLPFGGLGWYIDSVWLPLLPFGGFCSYVGSRLLRDAI